LQLFIFFFFFFFFLAPFNREYPSHTDPNSCNKSSADIDSSTILIGIALGKNYHDVAGYLGWLLFFNM
jgi:hypothetical protein